MTLDASYLGTVVPFPQRFVEQSQPGIRNAARAPLSMLTAQIVRATFTDVSTADTDGVSVSHVGAAVAGTTNMTIGGALATAGVATFVTPRNVVITVTHGSSVVAMSGTITGTDQYGRVITEAWSVTAGTTSKTFTGVVAFKTITSITETIAADASANTIIAGDGVVLGLPFRSVIGGVATAVKEIAIGAIVVTGTLVAGSTTANTDYRGTYLPSAAPNGTNDYSVWYLCEDVSVQP